MIYAGVPSLGFGVGGRPCSNFLASAVVATVAGDEGDVVRLPCQAP